MSIKVKSTAVAIATASAILSFSVPSQAGEHVYLYELENIAEFDSQQEGVNRYLDTLSDSEKLEYGKRHCKLLEHLSIKEILELFREVANDYLQQGTSYQIVKDYYDAEGSMLYASVKGLCPEYEYKLDNFVSEDSEEEEEI